MVMVMVVVMVSIIGSGGNNRWRIGENVWNSGDGDGDISGGRLGLGWR